MNIQLTYTNGNGKRVVKYFSEPMEIIGYIYRCWAAAMNAESSRRIKEKLANDPSLYGPQITDTEGGAE